MSTRQRIYRVVIVLAKLLVLLAIVLVLARTIDSAALFALLGNAHWLYLLGAIALANLVPMIMAFRLGYVADLSGGQLVGPLFKSHFFNTFLPAQIGGDLYKITVLMRSVPSRKQAISVVFADRIIGVTSALLIAIAGLILGQRYFQDRRIYGAVGIYVGALAVIYLIVMFRPQRLIAWSQKWSRPSSILHNLWATLNATNETLVAKLRRGMLYGILAYMVPIAVNLLAMLALRLRVDFEASLYYVPVIAITTVTLPFSFNGLGVREGLFVLLFSMAGYSVEEALSMALVSLLASLVVSMVGGVVMLFDGKSEQQCETVG